MYKNYKKRKKRTAATAVRFLYKYIYTILFREVHGNGCALPLHAVQLHRCVVHLGNMLDDGQPQPGPAGLFAAAFVHSKEAFKDTLPVLLRYADAGVCHL